MNSGANIFKQIHCAIMVLFITCLAYGVSMMNTSSKIQDPSLSPVVESVLTTSDTTAHCTEECSESVTNNQLACGLTSHQLQKRKKTVIAYLKKQIKVKKELENGYTFQFSSTDTMLNQLMEFIKTERKCCDFFVFTITVTGKNNTAWLSITGGKGVKEFIVAELDL